MALLGVVVVVALLAALKVMRRLNVSAGPILPAVDDPAFLAEKDRQENSLASLRTAAEDATAAVDEARAAAAAARTEAAAAKAEASAARSEARRIIDAARAEADSLLERAHRQAEADAEHARSAGPPGSET